MRRTSLLPLLSLHGAVPYSYSRKSVRSTLDCRTQNAPPPKKKKSAGDSAVCVRPVCPI
ncbi:MAG: hypothetical protein ACK55Z_14065 [bacterium]